MARIRKGIAYAPRLYIRAPSRDFLRKMSKLIAFRTGLSYDDSKVLAHILSRDLPDLILATGELPLYPYGKIYIADDTFKVKISGKSLKRKIREALNKE